MRNLNELVGQTSKFKLQSITNVHAKVIIVEDNRVETGQEEEVLFLSLLNLNTFADLLDCLRKKPTRICKSQIPEQAD